MSHRELFGVLPVVQTPFANDGSIDEAALVHELRWVLDHGVADPNAGMVTEAQRLDASVAIE